MFGTICSTARSSRRRATGSAGSSSRSSMPSTNHSAMVSPGCCRAITQMRFRPGSGVAHGDEVEIAALDGGAQRADPRARRRVGAPEQRLVPVPGIRLEIGVPDAVARRACARSPVRGRRSASARETSRRNRRKRPRDSRASLRHRSRRDALTKRMPQRLRRARRSRESETTGGNRRANRRAARPAGRRHARHRPLRWRRNRTRRKCEATWGAIRIESAASEASPAPGQCYHRRRRVKSTQWTS